MVFFSFCFSDDSVLCCYKKLDEPVLVKNIAIIFLFQIFAFRYYCR